MESTAKIEPKADEPGKITRSTIEFPYSDLDASVEVARGVHHAGGNSCDVDQLAAQLEMEAKGGGFRLRINSAQTFGLAKYERGGRVSITELGREVLEAATEKKARMDAFLTVPLFKKVYEEFKNGALPPQAGLERAMVAMGVGPKVADRARQSLVRSARQAGFFDQAADRLIKPIIKDAAGGAPPPAPDGEAPEKEKFRGGGGGDGGSDHPLIRGLLVTLPMPGTEWKVADRMNWLVMANSIFKAIYKTGSDAADVSITLQGGATTTQKETQ